MTWLPIILRMHRPKQDNDEDDDKDSDGSNCSPDHDHGHHLGSSVGGTVGGSSRKTPGISSINGQMKDYIERHGKCL